MPFVCPGVRFHHVAQVQVQLVVGLDEFDAVDAPVAAKAKGYAEYFRAVHGPERLLTAGKFPPWTTRNRIIDPFKRLGQSRHAS